MGATIGIDLGGTKVYGVRLAGGAIEATTKAKTPTEGGPPAVVDAVAEVARELGGGPDSVVGIGTPGVVDAATGVVQVAPNLPGWDLPFNLGEAVAAALGGATVAVENDVNAGTHAEHTQGAGRGADDLLCVFVGTGVGGGLVLDGRLRRGPTGLAGEIGHVVVVPGGRTCGCGGVGHLEAYAGRAGLERRARELHDAGDTTALVELAEKKGRMTSSVWEKALDAGDAVTRRLLDEAVDALGQAIAGAVTLVDLGLVVVGGGLADRLGEPFVERVSRAVNTRLFGGERTDVRVVPAALGDDAGAVGAALLAQPQGFGVNNERIP